MTPQERRKFFRHNLSPLYLPFYDELCTELSDHWGPYIGTRTFPEQDALYAKGRTVGPFGRGYFVTDAKGGESAHCYGCATDWAWFDDQGNLQWLKHEDLKWQNFIDTVTKVGLRSGSDWGDVDHAEIRISVSWKKDVLPEYQSHGMDSAMILIKSKMI